MCGLSSAKLRGENKTKMAAAPCISHRLIGDGTALDYGPM